jgi:hypothetical protein
MSKQPPKAKVKEKGFLESVREKIGSGMGYIDSVMKTRTPIMPTRGYQQPSPAMYKATDKKKPAAKKP